MTDFTVSFDVVMAYARVRDELDTVTRRANGIVDLVADLLRLDELQLGAHSLLPEDHPVYRAEALLADLKVNPL